MKDDFFDELKAEKRVRRLNKGIVVFECLTIIAIILLLIFAR